jgi:hypothetical protein
MRDELNSHKKDPAATREADDKRTQLFSSFGVFYVAVLGGIFSAIATEMRLPIELGCLTTVRNGDDDLAIAEFVREWFCVGFRGVFKWEDCVDESFQRACIE